MRCEAECVGDAECSAGTICCFNGCGYQCTDSVLTVKLPEYDAPKIGTCPDSEPVQFITFLHPCVDLCDADNDCPGLQICCSNGCARTCHNPILGKLTDDRVLLDLEKTGYCPASNTLGGVCDEECELDTHCKGNLKCCSNGCGLVCTAPEKAKSRKPGVCPAGVTSNNCSPQCLNDYDCPDDLLCCGTGCSQQCVSPTCKYYIRFLMPDDSFKIYCSNILLVK